MEEKKAETIVAAAATATAATAPATESASPVAENGSNNTTQEVTSTTQNDPTKRSIRVDIWQKLRQSKCGVGFNAIFNRIPNFVNSDKAAALLVETDEFKNAKKVKVNITRALNAAKLQTLLNNKDLYLPATRDSSALCLHVDVPEGADEAQKKSILFDFQKHRTEITLDNKVELDLVIIGAVVVSRDGYCIGRGNGFVDQNLGLLIEVGCITPKTVIATLVHDIQVVDELPKNLFQKHDVPVDLIVTPTQVIRVEKRLPRPSGIFWELLSERRLKLLPALQTLKEKQEKEGKVIVLKEENTDVEQSQKNRRRQPMRRRYQRRFTRRRPQSQTDTEQQGDSPQKPQIRRQRRYNPRQRNQTKSEGEQSAPEGKSQERRQAGQSNDRRKQRPRKNRPSRDFCVKLSNFGRSLRVTDLKQELRKRECKPLYITWKGQFGKCLLHFGKRTGEPSSEDEIEKVMKALNNMQITVSSGGANNNIVENGQGDGIKALKTKTFNLNVELIKFNNKTQPEGQENGATEDAVVVKGENVTRVETVGSSLV